MSQHFELAAEEIKPFVEKMSDDQKLEIYGLYKQATVGDNTTSKPGMFDFKGKAKWEAWNKCKGKSQDQAKAEYVAAVEKVTGKKF